MSVRPSLDMVPLVEFQRVKDELLRARLELEVLRQGFHLQDPVTGLLNSYAFEQTCADLIAESDQDKTFCLVIFRVDTTDSRVLLDPKSHARFIAEVAELITPPEGMNAIVGRLGSRHFGLFFQIQTSITQALDSVLEAILDSASRPMPIAGQTLRPVLRSGISLWPQDGATFSDVHHHAEIALNQAVRQDSPTAVTYHHAVKQSHSERLALVSALHQALQNNELRIFYQPQIEFEGGEFKKAEALLRWAHPSLGLLVPDQFLKLAESEGLLFEFTNWIISRVGDDLSLLRARIHPEFAVSINVSPAYISDFKAAEIFLSKMVASKLPTGSLVFEITEDTLLQPGKETLAALDALKSLGISIAIDDFGVGYSCLSYLQKIPIDIIKIDKQFVEPFSSSMEGFALCKAVIHLALDLGKSVMVEGLETSHQVDLVHAAGAQFGQGYFFSWPLPLEELISFGHKRASI